MKYLESIKLVQFFLFEKQDIRVKEITGIFGPNASGKSTLIDAVQIAMFGANGRLVSLNAQADERTTTRTIRSYCLGMHDETKAARENATTYITLLWRDSITNEPISMGVCISASADKDGHEVRGRYIVRGVELAMADHIEIVNNEERPRAWETFRHHLIESAKVSGENPFFADSERYLQAALLALRGSGGVASAETFKSAFRFALRMRFDKSVDHIVRHDVFEARPTNIQKFKEVTDSFRKLAQLVAQVKAKIEDGAKVETEFAKAAVWSKRAVTWKGLAHVAERDHAFDEMNLATVEKTTAEDEYEQKERECATRASELVHAENEEQNNRRLRESHTAHKDHGKLLGDLQRSEKTASEQSKSIQDSMRFMSNTLGDSAKSEHLTSNAASLSLVAKAVEDALSSSKDISHADLETLIKPAVKESTLAVEALFLEGVRVNRLLTSATDRLQVSQGAMSRVASGRSRLNDATERLMTELSHNGVNPTPVCDLVRVTDPDWQPIIESYLGRNVQALLVKKHEEVKAFRIYRGMTGPRAVFGAKIVAESKQFPVESIAGTVAELIEGSDPAAVAYLRKRFGDMKRATTDDEALAENRTMTQDGMIVQFGEYDRKEPVPKSMLKIGTDGNDAQKDELKKEIIQQQKQVELLEKQQKTISNLVSALNRISRESVEYMLKACDEMHSAMSLARSLAGQLQTSADIEYVRLCEAEKLWNGKAGELKPIVNQLLMDVGKLLTKRDQARRQEEDAAARWKVAFERAEKEVNTAEYDNEFASEQSDMLVKRFQERYRDIAEHCMTQESEAKKSMGTAITRGSKELGVFREKYREQGSLNLDDWRKEQEWMSEVLKRLRDTELSEFEAQMKEAYRASQETFRADVAIALSNNLEHLDKAMKRLNSVLKTCPVFSNGERYQFKRTVRPHLKALMKFVEDVATFGPNGDLLGSAGDIPEEFQKLLDEKTMPGTAGMQSPLDDYREFFEFDIEIHREDSLTNTTSMVGNLSKRLGTGSGGEHRAPLYVIAGAALASAYRLDSGSADGLCLILLDEAFNKMDTGNIVATMRYLEQLGLQIFMASPGDNLGTLTAFLHRYYDILRDAENSAILISGHDVSETDRELFRSDLAEFNEELIAEEMSAMRASRIQSATGAMETV